MGYLSDIGKEISSLPQSLSPSTFQNAQPPKKNQHLWTEEGSGGLEQSWLKGRKWSLSRIRLFNKSTYLFSNLQKSKWQWSHGTGRKSKILQDTRLQWVPTSILSGMGSTNHFSFQQYQTPLTEKRETLHFVIGGTWDNCIFLKIDFESASKLLL